MMKIDHDENGTTIWHTPFEVAIYQLLFQLYGGNTIPMHENKERWDFIQELKKMAQDELK